jgi:hypothetical protein
VAQPGSRLTEKYKTHIYCRDERHFIKWVQFKAASFMPIKIP